MLHAAALLTAKESQAADAAAIAGGIPGETLMENAGKAVVDIITQKYPQPRPVLVACGTGNNGGDGFVIARLLAERNWPVILTLVGKADEIKGDCATARDKWLHFGGSVQGFNTALLKESQLVVDAIFGTGISRPVEGAAKDAITAINNSRLPVVAVDIASGINTDNGEIMGQCIRALHTVTFGRPKPGHLLLPGKANTGELHVYDIGISGESVKPDYFLNAPALWGHVFPFPMPEANKYTRGHALVIGGTVSTTGASRLAAMGALRGGAGLVSIVCTPETLPIYTTTMTSVMTRTYATVGQLATMMEDKHITAVLVGPGAGIGETTRKLVLQMLTSTKACVVDADGLSVFESNPKMLFNAIIGPTVLTPHEGEFARLFRVTGSKPQKALEAAKESNAVVVYKGSDTVIAAPDGRVAINANAPPSLATAGTGDVLAGIITSLMAQGMPAFEAACAGTWWHGEAAAHFGPGLIAEDLPGLLPLVLQKLYA